jgi:hypothetical protein
MDFRFLKEKKGLYPIIIEIMGLKVLKKPFEFKIFKIKFLLSI